MPFQLLNDVTVIECATFVTGPYAGTLLADLGARVIKLESPPDGDPYRYFAPDPCFSFNFAHLNRNKESLAVDLKSTAGREICIELIKTADVFIENFRPGTAERLGLGYEKLSALNPRLVYCSISAFGQTGPYADKPGFDTLGQAASGLLSLLNDVDRPKIMGMAISDYVTGLSAGYGVLGALAARGRTGSGLRVETSLLRATLSFIGETAAGFLRTGVVPDRKARVKNAHAFAFVCRDRLPVVVHCSVPEKFWLSFLQALEREDLASDPRFASRDARREHFEELEAELASVFARRTRQEWLERFAARDVPAAPLYNVAEALADPQVRHLDLTEEVEHPKSGKLGFVRGPVAFQGAPAKTSGAPPLVGEHTVAILTEMGYGREVVDEWIAQGVVKTFHG
ncbi:MAG TPA: CoA transferase [candidate division Zixibacteria bacterium]|nr:CoA transferase [candidate division Zixibacteria bacterium]